ncbi:MAG TPA: gliding motility-associated ABC transporter permease subunit GldF [Saprospiraceae bacterium]|nr:gliding motility-associated ABC transporter permease subunit GldF [Saprospiraceae bacterium]
MAELIYKEIRSFFSSIIGYLVIAVFLIIMGSLMWVFPDYSILDYNVASLDQLFSVSPFIFLFLIPAVTMRAFAEEMAQGTMETLLTKPLTETQIVFGKFFANLILVLLALLPSLLYYYSVYQLGSPKGNLDSGAIAGSYLGLILLAAGFVAIGLFASSLTKNQIVGFILASFLCFLFYSAFYYISKLPVFFGKVDDVVLQLGIDEHYNQMSKGLIDLKDLVYFGSLIFFFLWLTVEQLKSRLF